MKDCKACGQQFGNATIYADREHHPGCPTLDESLSPEERSRLFMGQPRICSAEVPKEMPKAVWAGSLFGVRVYVLEDGRRIVDAEDVHRLLNGEMPEGFDMEDFGEAFARWQREPVPGPGAESKK